MKSRFFVQSKMAEPDFHQTIRKQLDDAFSFLKEHGFSDFSERQLAYEYHYESSNAHATIDIWFEFAPNSPFWATVNGYHIETLELDNPTIKRCYEQLAIIADGDAIRDAYLKELVAILKRHTSVLYGDTALLEKNHQLLVAQREALERDRKMREKLYTCEFELADGMAVYEYQASSLAEIKTYLVELKDSSICNIEVVDWNGNKVEFSLF